MRFWLCRFHKLFCFWVDKKNSAFSVENFCFPFCSSVILFSGINIHGFAGCVLVHGQNMVRGQVDSMPVTAMKQQSKKEWYISLE